MEKGSANKPCFSSFIEMLFVCVGGGGGVAY